MSETALLEKSLKSATEDEKDKEPEEELFAKWEEQFKQVRGDYNLRETILRDIKEGRRPPPTADEVSLEDLRRKNDKQRQEDFEKRIKKPVIERRAENKIYQMDTILNQYSQEIRKMTKEKPNDSVPPGEVLRQLDSWDDYGWSNDDKKMVKENLKAAFSGVQLDDKRAEIMMEILLCNGMLPKNLTNVELGKLKASSDEEFFNKFSDGQRNQYKNRPEVFFMEKYLEIDSDLIEHFVLSNIFAKDNDYNLYYHTPKNIEDLAYHIIQAPGKGEDGYGIQGERPVLEMRIEWEKDKNGNYIKDPETGLYKISKKYSGYRINTANMVSWARYNMYTAYDLDREDPQDFFQKIAVKTKYPITLQEMLLNPDQYFVSKDGETKYNSMLLEWYKEAVIFGTARTWDASYREVAGDSEELMKVFRAMYNTKNLFTRGALGSNILNLLSTMPLDFEGRKDGKSPSDSKFGTSVIDIYRAYDSISDFVGLQRVLGKGSKFFTRAGWAETIHEIEDTYMDSTGVSKLDLWAKKEERQYFEDAFDKNGEISSEKNRIAFIKWISIFGEKMGGARREFTVRYALRNAIAEKYGDVAKVVKDKEGKYLYTKHAFFTTQGRKGEKVEDEDTIRVAEAIAWSLAKPFGAGAKNDPDSVVHDYMARIYNTQLSRQKYPHRGDKFGNEYSVMQFKRTGIDVLNGIVTETPVDVLDKNGKQVRDGKGKPATRNKTPMEVFTELSDFQTVAVARTRDLQRQLEAMKDKNSQAYKDKKKEVQDHIDLSNQKYQNLAQQISFGQRTLSNYYEDHLRNSVDLYKQLMSGEEIGFEKFTSYDVFGGVRFKGQEFQAEVQDKWIHKIRYMMDTYPSLNFNQTVRVMDQTETNHRHWRKDKDGNTHPGEPVYHEVKLGEAMFGHEMLNRPKFWKRDKFGRAIPQRDQNGRRIKGSYEIDYQKVQDNKQEVWKQWFLMKIAGDLYSHRALHANEPRMNFTYYQKILESIGRIPKDILQTEFDFKKSHVSEYFFNEADMGWLKNKARVETFDLYYKAILKDLFIDDKPEEGIGLVLALSLAMKAIVANKI